MANSTSQGNGRGLRHCSFCGRNERQVNFLIPSSTGAYICDYCVQACNDLIEGADRFGEESKSSDRLTLEALPRPKQMKEAV